MKPFERLLERLQQKADNVTERAVTYVAMGDSVTQGCMQAGYVEYENVYHHVFKRGAQQRYPGTVFNVINSGVSGDSAAPSRTRWERDVLMYKPDLVTIFFGHNDAHGGREGLAPFIQAVGDLVHRIRSETEAEILLMTPCMMMSRDNDRIAEVHRPSVPQFIKLAEEGHLLSYVNAIREFALANDVPCLDVYAFWEQMEQAGTDIHSLLSNGINHPDPEFHIRLGKALEEKLFEN